MWKDKSKVLVILSVLLLGVLLAFQIAIFWNINVVLHRQELQKTIPQTNEQEVKRFIISIPVSDLEGMEGWVPVAYRSPIRGESIWVGPGYGVLEIKSNGKGESLIVKKINELNE